MFRRLALAIPGAQESAHVNHPDFRLNGRIYATLGYPDDAHGMIKLTPDQQRNFCRKAHAVFRPAAGAWGRQGSTIVNLAAARVGLIRPALAVAAKTVAAKGNRA
jgi:hypothetical protein